MIRCCVLGTCYVLVAAFTESQQLYELLECQRERWFQQQQRLQREWSRAMILARHSSHV